MLCGREVERAQIGALLDAARDSHSGALVVRGEPGIGKSALLEDARDGASDMHVLTARGVESEAELPFAALHQLLRPALDQMDTLPAPQAAALGGALGLTDGSGHERFLVFAGCLTLLSELAEQKPVLCLVDDAHWLDDASADALRFVARRLHGEGIVILFGAREGDERRFDAPDLTALFLDGLDAAAAAELLARSVDGEVAPVVRDALLERTGGNALALIEVPGALTDAQRAGIEPLPDALPLPREVEGIFLDRVRRLPADAQQMLLLAAADDSESTVVVARAGEGLGSLDALDPVERAGLVKVRGNRIEFRHPLVRSAVYDASTSSQRRAAHRALANALEGIEEHADRRAWHLAAASLEHDAGTVRALDEAAERARARGAHEAASRALERAADLSDGWERGRRLVAAAGCSTRAGADARAAALAAQARPFVDDSLMRAEIAKVLGIAEARSGRPADVYPVLVEAAREVASADPRQALELLLWSVNAAADAGDRKLFHASCEEARAIDLPEGDDAAAFLVDLLTGVSAMGRGDTAVGAPLLDRAATWGAQADDELYVYWAALAPLWLGDDERLAALLDRSIKMCRERGAAGWLAESLSLRAAQLGLAQHFDAAELTATEALGLCDEIGTRNRAMMPLAVLGYVAAIRGDYETAHRQATEVLETATARGLAVRVANAHHVFAMIDLSAGRFPEALVRFQTLAEESLRRGDQFLAVVSAPGLVESAVRANEPAVAEAALEPFAQWAAHARVRWAPPLVASCRGMIAPGDEATEHFEDAIALEADARPFDRGRIRLMYGEHLRRERRRRDARVQLRAALEVFESHRAVPWAERARTELRASGETARKRDDSTRAELTAQERQIAGLVAAGMSNKEVAAQLFLSPRTIDAHLRNVFAKLEITSRTQLARIPLDGGEIADASQPALART